MKHNLKTIILSQWKKLTQTIIDINNSIMFFLHRNDLGWLWVIEILQQWQEKNESTQANKWSVLALPCSDMLLDCPWERFMHWVNTFRQNCRTSTFYQPLHLSHCLIQIVLEHESLYFFHVWSCTTILSRPFISMEFLKQFQLNERQFV